MQTPYQTINVTPEASASTEKIEPVYSGSTKSRGVLKTLALAGVCAACVFVGVKLERDGHTAQIESMFAAPMMARAPAVVASAPRAGVQRRGAQRTAARPMRSRPYSTRVRAEGEGGAEAAPTAPTEEVEDMGDNFKTADGRVLKTAPRMSEAIPFIEAPAHLDGTMVGDRGLDPFNFGADGKLVSMREAEIKHARIAMLAAAGWPISEKLDAPLAKLLNLPVALNADGTAPSLINGGLAGGLDSINVLYWGAVLGASVAIEFAGRDNKAPGDYEWDPLNFMADKTEEQKRNMQEKELKNGRLAMMAIAGFAIQEALYHTPVTQETPAFFQPIWETLSK